jgi:transposase-like protein
LQQYNPPPFQKTERKAYDKPKGRKIMVQRRVFIKEFKEEAIALTRTSGRTVTDIAGSLGVDVNMLCRWKRESERAVLNGNIKVFPGKGNARDEEVARLRKENADLRESNEILKKAMAVFTVKKPR